MIATEELTDVYGSKVEIGSKVAFNYSGQLRLGTVTSIGRIKRSPYGYVRCIIGIDHQSGSIFPDKDFTMVTSPFNLVVIKEFYSLRRMVFN